MKTENSYFTGVLTGALLSGVLLLPLMLMVRWGADLPMPPGVEDLTQVQPIPIIVPTPKMDPPSVGPADAPITLTEYADYYCVFCKRSFPVIQKVAENYPDKVRRVFRHFPLSRTPGQGSFLIHEAAVCAQEQGKFWSFHEAVFTYEGRLQKDGLEGIANKIGLEREAFKECLASERPRKILERDIQQASTKAVSGTPAFFINDVRLSGAQPYEKFAKTIEWVLDPSKPEPFPVRKVAPDNVSFEDLEGRPALGPRDAPVTIVEFGDFYCPFCKKASITLEQLMQNYPKQVRRIWRHYPMAMHPGAPRVHQASECAHQQKKFWDFHHGLFERMGQFRSDESLIALAKQLELDTKDFEKCLAGDSSKKQVQQDFEKGSEIGVRGTPTFFINGKRFVGARPYAHFDEAVQKELEKISAQ